MGEKSLRVWLFYVTDGQTASDFKLLGSQLALQFN